MTNERYSEIRNYLSGVDRAREVSRKDGRPPMAEGRQLTFIRDLFAEVSQRIEAHTLECQDSSRTSDKT